MPIAAFDNADSPIQWLEDALAVVATGDNLARRKLYTTIEKVAHSQHKFLVDDHPLVELLLEWYRAEADSNGEIERKASQLFRELKALDEDSGVVVLFSKALRPYRKCYGNSRKLCTQNMVSWSSPKSVEMVAILHSRTMTVLRLAIQR